MNKEVQKRRYSGYPKDELIGYLEVSMHYYKHKVLGFNRMINLGFSTDECLRLISNEKEHYLSVLNELDFRGEDLRKFPQELNYLERLN